MDKKKEKYGVVNFTYVPDFINAVVEQEKLLVV